jgi:hypothetical protein
VAENKVAPMYQRKQATAQQAGAVVDALTAWVPWFELLVFRSRALRHARVKRGTKSAKLGPRPKKPLPGAALLATEKYELFTRPKII